jgi:hypothetical protein
VVSEAVAPAEVFDALAIFRKADAETRRVIEDEMKELRWRRRHGIYLEWGGLISGLLVSGLFLWAAVHLSLNGQPWVGGVLGAIDIVALATVFVKGRE